MMFPDELTNAVDGLTEIEAAHLNNLEAKVGINGSTDPTSLDYLLKNPASLDPGHKHTAGAFSGGSDGEVFFKDPADHAWKPAAPDAAGLVAKTGDQTVGGVKTFAAIPKGPSADPTLGDELTRKAYVDTQRDTRVAKAGDAMTGPLTLPGDPTQDLHAAPKQYVDSWGMPVGVILPFGGSSAPVGYLLCDGVEVSRTTYARLFAVIGTTYGAGDGSTTFNLPNLKGRLPVGLDAAQPEFDALGETGGEKTHTLTVEEIPSHTHEQADGAAATFGSGSASGSNGSAAPKYTTGAAGGGQPHNNLPPYLVVNYIIKY